MTKPPRTKTRLRWWAEEAVRLVAYLAWAILAARVFRNHNGDANVTETLAIILAFVVWSLWAEGYFGRRRRWHVRMDIWTTAEDGSKKQRTIRVPIGVPVPSGIDFVYEEGRLTMGGRVS